MLELIENFINYTSHIIIILNSYTSKMITKTTTKRWGNSLGVVLPRETVIDMNLREGETITIEITKKENPLRELFGSLKLGNTEKLLRELRKDLEGKWLK